MIPQKQTHTVPIVALGAFGLTAVVIWADLIGHWSGFASPLIEIQTFGNARLFFLSGYTSAAIATVAIRRLDKRQIALLEFSLPVIACVGTLLFGFSYAQHLIASNVLAIAGLVLCGIGYYGITVFFYCELAKLERIANGLWAIALSLFLKTALGDALGYASSDTTQIILATALPCFSLACLVAMKALGTSAYLDRYRSSRTFSKTETHNLLYYLIAISIAIAAFRGSGHLGLWGEGHFGSPVASMGDYVFLGLSFACFAYLAIIRNSDNQRILRYQPAFLIIFGGFLVYALRGNLIAPVAESAPLSWLVMSIELLGHLTCWALVLTGIRTTNAPLWRFQGISDTAYGIVALAWIALIQNADTSIQTIIAIVAFLSMAVAIRPLSKKPIEAERGYTAPIAREILDNREMDDEQSLSSISEGIAHCYLDLAKANKLSPRETDVFMYLAHGRSRPYICDALFLSDGTVKTHISHIYKKFGVHSREELLTVAQNAFSHGQGAEHKAHE